MKQVAAHRPSLLWLSGGRVDPIRVLVVDDSVVVRKIVTDVLAQDPAIDVVGTAVNGRAALAKIDQLKAVYGLTMTSADAHRLEERQ